MFGLWEIEAQGSSSQVLENAMSILFLEERERRLIMCREKCGFCGHVLDDEDKKLEKKFGVLGCPECCREGCDLCMPSGRGYVCPECESD